MDIKVTVDMWLLVGAGVIGALVGILGTVAAIMILGGRGGRVAAGQSATQSTPIHPRLTREGRADLSSRAARKQNYRISEAAGLLNVPVTMVTDWIVRKRLPTTSDADGTRWIQATAIVLLLSKMGLLAVEPEPEIELELEPVRRHSSVGPVRAAQDQEKEDDVAADEDVVFAKQREVRETIRRPMMRRDAPITTVPPMFEQEEEEEESPAAVSRPVVGSTPPVASSTGKLTFKQHYWYLINGRSERYYTLREVLQVLGLPIKDTDKMDWNKLPNEVRSKITREPVGQQ